MKAVIIEVNDNHSIALKNNGEFIKLNTLPHYNIGDEIDISIRRNHFVKYSAIAASLVFIINICMFLIVWATPYSYISMDINPSIEIVTNRFDYIISATGINNDGINILAHSSMSNKSLNDGISIVIDRLAENNYLSKDDGSALVFAIMCDDQQKVENIEKTISTIATSNINSKGNNEVYVVTGNVQKHKSAKELNISSGKLMLIEEIQNSKNDYNFDELKNMTVKEIVKIVKSDSNYNSGGQIKKITQNSQNAPLDNANRNYIPTNNSNEINKTNSLNNHSEAPQSVPHKTESYNNVAPSPKEILPIRGLAIPDNNVQQEIPKKSEDVTANNDVQPIIPSLVPQERDKTLAEAQKLTVLPIITPSIVPETKTTIQPEIKSTLSETKPVVQPETKPTVQPETKSTVQPETKPTVLPETKPTVLPETKPTVQPETKQASERTQKADIQTSNQQKLQESQYNPEKKK